VCVPSTVYDVENGLMVLTAYRIWRFHDERVHCAKSAVGAWALERDQSHRTVRGALARWRLHADATIEPAEVAQALAPVRAKLATPRALRPAAVREGPRMSRRGPDPRAGSSAVRAADS
jgi:hypothetical protein